MSVVSSHDNARQKLFAQYGELVDLAEKICRCPEYRDLAHAVLIKIEKRPNLDQLVEGDGFRRYASTAIWNQYHGDRSRERKRRQRYEAEAQPLAMEVSDRVIMREQVAILVGGLTADQRVIFEAHYYEGIPVKTIAEWLNCSEGTVYKWLRKSKAQVKHAVETQCTTC